MLIFVISIFAVLVAWVAFNVWCTFNYTKSLDTSLEPEVTDWFRPSKEVCPVPYHNGWYQILEDSIEVRYAYWDRIKGAWFETDLPDSKQLENQTPTFRGLTERSI